MIISGKSTARVRRQLSGWNQLRKKSEKIASDLTLDISELLPLFDQRISTLSQELNRRESMWKKSPALCFEAVESCKNVPANLITARQLLGWSQTEFGIRCGISANAVSRYERTNYNAITLGKAIAIAEVLLLAFAERDPHQDPNA